MSGKVNEKLNELFSLEGKVVVMTGAAGGIGAALSKGLASIGANMILCDFNEEGLKQVEAEIKAEGNNATSVVINMLDLDSIEKCVSTVIEKFGKIDVLVNMAGINKRVPLLEGDEETFDRIIGVNLKGVYFLGQAVAKHMKEAKTGSIINVASYNAVSMLGGCGVYGASKSGIAALTRSQAVEWAQYGIRSNAISPGHISTPLTAPTWAHPTRSKYLLDRIAMARPGMPEELLGMLVLLASDASSYMTGMLYHVDGGSLAGGQPWEMETNM